MIEYSFLNGLKGESFDDLVANGRAQTCVQAAL